MVKQSAHKTLIIACGALAKDIDYLLKQFSQQAELQYLPADLHNRPEDIVSELKAILDKRAKIFNRILIGYGDCGTQGALDVLLKSYPNALRLPGVHCSAVYAGLSRYNALQKKESGALFLTDYLIRHFDDLTRDVLESGQSFEYFGEARKKLIFLAQRSDQSLKIKAQEIALKLGLSFQYHLVGFGNLATAISFLGVEPVSKIRTSHV